MKNASNYLEKPEFEIPIRYPFTDSYELIIDGVSNHLSLIQEGMNIKTIEQWGFDEFPESSTIKALLCLICEKYKVKSIINK